MKDVEIGAVNNVKVYMKLDDLFRIANKEIQEYAEDLEHTNGELQWKLDNATEALRFYADVGVYECYDKYESTAVQHDGGQKARETLKEIEK